jgi:hypothetical protein
MLDDLRNSASQAYEEEQAALEEGMDAPKPPRAPFLGMTAQQRFLLALMLFIMVCVMGGFCLLLFEKIWLPIY